MHKPFSIITSPEKRYFGFDIIRAFSVLLVINLHFLQAICPVYKWNYFNFPLPDPVDMFFVCSGFLIGYHFLIDIHKVDTVTKKYVGRFLIMRWGRTLPAYYIMIFFFIGIVLVFARRLDIPFSNFFFLQNFVNYQSYFYKETWTVSVEEWFYVLFPLGFMLILKLTNNNKNKSYLGILLFMIISSILLKIVYYKYIYSTHTFKDFAASFRLLVVLRMDTIAIGLFAAYICYHFETFWDKYKFHFLIIGLIIYFFSIFYSWAWANEMLKIEEPTWKRLPWDFPFAATSFTTFYHYVFYYLVSPISIALCLPYLKTIKYKPNFISKLTIYISFISYAMFLLHDSFLKTLCLGTYVLGLVKSIPLIYCTWLLLVFLLSDVFYRKIELPFMNKRKFWIKKLKLEE